MITLIHIPRTAGRTIAAALDSQGYPQDSSHNKREWYKLPATYLTVVRNPYDRVESIWRNFINSGSFEYFIDHIQVYSLYGPMVDYIEADVEVLRYERLVVDWFHFCKRNELNYVELGWVGKSEDVKINWTPGALEIVNDYYAEDFRVFKYKLRHK